MAAGFWERLVTRALALVLVASALALGAAGWAEAAPPKPKFGPAIDAVPSYNGARNCDPHPKPGVVAFRNLVVDAYPGTGPGGIERSCSGGGTSEHHEGRAWDWMVSASDSSDRKKAEEVIHWLLKEDRFGNDFALARRLGIMYIIWNRRTWMPYSGWRTYCVQRKGACRDPEDNGVRSPHTDHVHFSFTWAGARKETTFWHPNSTMIAAADGPSGGGALWMLGRNGSVLPAKGAGYYGARSADARYVALAATPTGSGYWVASGDGKVTPFGDAPRRGDARDLKMRIVDIEATPSGRGYWLLGGNGRVLPFGDARRFGDLRGDSSSPVAIEPTATGDGYWLLSRGGRVVSFGDAAALGNPATDIDAADLVRSPTGGGYWIVSTGGRVFSFGDAASIGGTTKSLSSEVVGAAATSDGGGLWVVTESGRVRSFGNAR